MWDRVQTDTILTTLMTNMQGRILKEKLIDTNGTRQGRSCSIQMLINLKIVSNLQFLVVQFFLLVHPLCVCMLRNVMYLFVHCVCPGISLLLYNSHQSDVPVIIDEEEQWWLVCMSHEGVGTTVEAKAMSGHFGRDETVSLLTSKVYFPGITNKVKQFVESCEAC